MFLTLVRPRDLPATWRHLACPHFLTSEHLRLAGMRAPSISATWWHLHLRRPSLPPVHQPRTRHVASARTPASFKLHAHCVCGHAPAVDPLTRGGIRVHLRTFPLLCCGFSFMCVEACMGRSMLHEFLLLTCRLPFLACRLPCSAMFSFENV